ncbi:MAG: hypothetical protein M1839_007049 [Geoglossum umbratile]|nr:MAG: hypothetical protein M1839_007049 [Geoglossum umbratile]
MDITRFSFGAKLPTLLNSISAAHFVAIDFEFSGIHTKIPGLRSGANSGKQTLQERYKECKEAAEKYQVLQVGVSCVEEDKVTGVYVVRPYNFNLSPLIEHKIDLDRDFTFQSGEVAISFLLDNGFRFDKPITAGVPYLSRQEEADVHKRARERDGRSRNIAYIQLPESDTQSLAFVQRVREQIGEWTSRIPLRPDYLNISPLGLDSQPDSTHGLSGFEKRLVHQLVRAEFPGFVTISKPTFIQVIAYDEARETSHRSSRLNALKAQISKQTGLRWLVEAMVGGDLSGINPMDCAQNTTGEPVFVNKDTITSQLNGLRDALRGHHTILVGHNLFTDLVYFYNTFIGILPDQVDDFGEIIHQLFPMVIDTKYLATHELGPRNLRSALEDLEEDLQPQIFPTIKIHYDHSKYHLDSKAYAHEAGYDSFLTATILIKLATRLEAEGEYVVPEADPCSDDSFTTAPESVDSPLASPVGSPQTQAPTRGGVGPSVSPQGVSHIGGDGSATGPPHRSSRKKRRKLKAKRSATETQFSHPTKFDLLVNLENEEGSTELSRSAEAECGDTDTDVAAPEPDDSEVILMPPFHSDFWRVYGNKLRVFGTKEETFCLAD